jgi:hypothetical protein
MSRSLSLMHAPDELIKYFKEWGKTLQNLLGYIYACCSHGLIMFFI